MRDSVEKLKTHLWLLLPLLIVVSGCRGIIGFGQRPGVGSVNAKPVLAPETTQEQLIDYLHANTDKVRSWISRECTLTVRMPNGMRTKLNGTMACEEPRNFRLLADKLGIISADIGSNAGYCWWTMQPGDKVIYTVNHDDMDFVRNHPMMRQTMSLPFEPDWLMEVLGVTRLSTDGMTMHRDANPNVVNLASEHSSGDGRTFRRITVVDLHRGRVVSHRMVDSSNNTIARARLSDFQFVDNAQLPGRIDVDWPSMNMSMTIAVRNLNINSELQPNLWQPPTSKSLTQVSLADQLRRIEQAPHQFRKMELVPPRPQDRPIYDGQVYGAGGVDDELPWEDEEPKKKWYQFPWLKRR